VAVDGNDRNPGTETQPFATLERARDAVRELKKSRGLPKGGVAVFLRGGVYRIEKTFALSEEDSGTEAAPVVYRSYPNEEVRLVGGKEIGGFQPVKDAAVLRRIPEEARGHVLQADLKARKALKVRRKSMDSAGKARLTQGSIKMKQTILNVGREKVLLFDDALIEEKSGFRLTMNPAVRAEEPVLVPDRPWEIGGICGDSNLSVVDDDGVYRMWYVVEYIEARPRSAGRKKLRGEEKLDAKTLADLRGAERKYALCHAVSSDSIHWEKPAAGVVPYRGGRKNNILFVDRLGCTVFKDPNAPPRERYKMIYGGGPRLPHVHLAEDIPVQEIYHAIYGAASPDGIHWKPYPKPIIPWYTDTTNVAYYDDRIKKYVAFVRSNEGMIYRDGKTVTPDKGSRLRYRAIGRTESKDFRKFPPPVRIMEPTPAERKHYATGVDYYNSAAVKYPFAADSYFMFSSNFYHEPDTLDVHLCTSRDGVNYSRWKEPFLGLGLEGAFDSKSIYMGTGMIRRGDHILMYYAGYDHTHGAHARRGPYAGGIGLARVRLDGFVSQNARPSGGRLLTVPLRFTGRCMSVNMDAAAGGWLRVELLDSRGRAIAGFSAADADPLWCNDTAKTVTWKGRSDLSNLKGQPIRVNFIGKGVAVYGFQFV